MLTKKEAVWIIITIIIYTFIIEFPIIQANPINILLLLLIPILIILTNILAKKIAAPYYSIEIEHKIWEFQRYGFYKRAYFKKPFPIGLVLPFLLTILSLGIIKPFTFLQFEPKNIPAKRQMKQQGARRATKKTEMNEEDPAFTAAWGFYALLLLAIIGAILSFFFNLRITTQLTKYSIYYGLWNLIPIGNLDGAKLFFGQAFVWVFVTSLYLVSLVLILVF